MLIRLYACGHTLPQCSPPLHVQEGRGASPAAVADPRVLHCLAEHLLRHDPKSAQALHLTCRAAANAVQQAVSKLAVSSQHVDIVHTVQAFCGLTQLKCTQCAIASQVSLLFTPGHMYT